MSSLQSPKRTLVKNVSFFHFDPTIAFQCSETVSDRDIVCGKEDVEALQEYHNNQFDVDGVLFKDLSQEERRSFRNLTLPIRMFNGHLRPSDRYEIFLAKYAPKTLHVGVYGAGVQRGRQFPDLGEQLSTGTKGSFLVPNSRHWL